MQPQNLKLPQRLPSRAELLEWCRNNAPDLRIQHHEDASGAQGTYDRETFELVATGDWHRDTIILEVWKHIRLRQADAVTEEGKDVDQDLTRQIIAARATGRHEAADQLEAELVAQRLGRPVDAIPRGRRPPEAYIHDRDAPRFQERTFNRKIGA